MKLNVTTLVSRPIINDLELDMVVFVIIPSPSLALVTASASRTIITDLKLDMVVAAPTIGHVGLMNE